MKRMILAAAIAASLTGCATNGAALSPTLIERPPFPVAEYEALPKTGAGTVTGQVFMKTLGGDVKVGAGNTVFLNPVTSYSSWTYENRAKPIKPSDPRLKQYMREVIADASGRFTFRNVPDGEYFVTGQVTWEAPVGFQGALRTQGGWIWKRVAVKGGELVEVMVTE